MSKLRKTINVVKNSLTVFGSAVLQVVVRPATKAANKLSELTDRFSKLSPETQKFIVKVALIVAAVGPAIVIIAKLTQGVGALYWNVGRMIKTVQGAESFASLITPGGKIVLILTGIAIAAVLVYKNWNKITAAAKNMQKTAVTALNAAGVDTKKLGSTVKSIAKTASSAFGTIGKGAGKIISGLRPVATFLSGAFKKAFTIVLSFVVARYSGWLKSTIDVVHGVTTAFKGIIEFISGVFTGNWKKAWNGVKNIFKGAFEALVGIAKAPLNTVIGLVNTAISGLNKVSVKIPSWVPGKYGGKQYGINIPKIPMLAKGTNNWSGGIVQINEKGGEIVDLPRGSRVYPHDDSVRMARNEGKKVYKIEKLADTIIVREEADIDKILGKRLNTNHCVYTENTILNAVICEKMEQCSIKNIKIEVQVNADKDMDSIEYGVVLSNLLDNAIEAEEQEKEENRYICLNIGVEQNMIHLVVSNYISESVLQNNALLETSKKNKQLHGIGLRGVKEFVNNKEGEIEIFEENHMFVVHICVCV